MEIRSVGRRLASAITILFSSAGLHAQQAHDAELSTVAAQEAVRASLPPSDRTDFELKALPLDLFFDYLGVRMNGTRADGKRIVINWNFSDTKQRFVLNLENAALTYTSGRAAADADVSVTLTRATLDTITLRQTTFPEAVKAGTVHVTGDAGKLADLFGLLDNFEPMFEVVEPKPAR